MVTSEYVPDTGDLIWLDLTPQARREQAGRGPRRPLSTKLQREDQLSGRLPGNESREGVSVRSFAPSGQPIKGVILSDHLKTSIGVSEKPKERERSPDLFLHKCANASLLFSVSRDSHFV